ncbi:MAG: hypothetical protein GYA24_01290 [Candidatus Lokiarchaeota archaeon]|nr:hypothetical protein [Candidatus Lokiarchaeota archaeon]
MVPSRYVSTQEMAMLVTVMEPPVIELVTLPCFSPDVEDEVLCFAASLPLAECIKAAITLYEPVQMDDDD